MRVGSHPRFELIPAISHLASVTQYRSARRQDARSRGVARRGRLHGILIGDVLLLHPVVVAGQIALILRCARRIHAAGRQRRPLRTEPQGTLPLDRLRLGNLALLRDIGVVAGYLRTGSVPTVAQAI